MTENDYNGTNYVSNDSSLGGDEFYDAVETIEKRMSTVSYGSARSTTSMAPSPAAAELMAALASSGDGRKIDVRETAIEDFASTTADEGPPGGSLGIGNVHRPSQAPNSTTAAAATARAANPFDHSCDTSTLKPRSSMTSRSWPPPQRHQPSSMVVMDISSTETTPTTTPGGGRGKVEVSTGLCSGSQSPSTPTPPGRPTSSMNPFAPTAAKTPSPTNPFIVGSTTRNPFVHVVGESPPGSVTGRSSASPPAPAPAPVPAPGDKARPPPLPPRRTACQGNTPVSSRKDTEASASNSSRAPAVPGDGRGGVTGSDTVGAANDGGVDLGQGSSRGSDAKHEGSRFMVMNKDTGQIFDLRDMERHLSPEEYSLLPSRDDLIALERQRTADSPMPSEPSSPPTRSSMSSVAASLAAAVGNARNSREKSRSLGSRVRRGLGMVANAAGVATPASGGGSGSGGGDSKNSGRTASGGIGAAARSAIAGIRVSFKGKDTSETLTGLFMLQELKAHSGPIWTLAFNQSGKFLATAGEDKRIVLHHVGNLTEDPYANGSSNLGKSGSPAGKGQEGAAGGRPPAPSTVGASERGRSSNDEPVASQERVSQGNGDCGEGCTRGSERKTDVPIFFGSEPCQVWTAHKADVVSLAWSRNDFLLSASLDNTVRLWHTTQPACLHLFKHNNIVTSVDFHPVYEHFFLSGCFDKKVRVWNIRDGHVQQWQQTPDMVTAARFSQDGSMIVVGLYMGQVLFYQTEGMRYFTQIECRNRRGPQKRGRKVTGFAFRSTARDRGRDSTGSTNGRPNGAAPAMHGSWRSGDNASGSDFFGGGRTPGVGLGIRIPEQILVTTNDSRIRLYNTDDFVMNAKYKGLINDTLQITASFSENGKQIISGSENGKVYVWSTGVVMNSLGSDMGMGDPASAGSCAQSPVSTTQKDTNKCHESFEASAGDPNVVTQALFVPESTARGCITALRGKISEQVAEAGGYCGCMILATDYEGYVRVYCKSSVILG